MNPIFEIAERGDLSGSIHVKIDPEHPIAEYVPKKYQEFVVPGSAFSYEESGEDGSSLYVAYAKADLSQLEIPEEQLETMTQSDVELRMEVLFDSEGRCTLKSSDMIVDHATNTLSNTV